MTFQEYGDVGVLIGRFMNELAERFPGIDVEIHKDSIVLIDKRLHPWPDKTWESPESPNYVNGVTLTKDEARAGTGPRRRKR